MAIIFVLFSARASVAFEAIDRVTHFGTTDKSITLTWDDQAPAKYYEVRLYHVEREDEVPAGSGRTESNLITFNLPRSGHFIGKVRACINAGVCSGWSESIDPAVASVKGEARGWWLYGYVAEPGEIIITQQREGN